jgi:signal transduction histidine kinase
MKLPIRLRLTIAFALGMALVLIGLGAFLYDQLGAELLRSVDSGLRSRAEVMVAGLGGGGGGNFADAPGSLVAPGQAFAQVLDLSHQSMVVDSTSAVAAGPVVTSASLAHVSGAVFSTLSVPGIGPSRILVVPAGGHVFVLVGTTLADRQLALTRLLVLFAIGGPIALSLTSGAGWVLAGAALRPVESLRREAAAISTSEPDRKLLVPATGDELARLATTLNDMLGRLHEALMRERRFVDEAAHELRTPLGVLKGELDLALSRPRDREELETALSRASQEADRLSLLAEDLLVLSRVSGGRLPVHREWLPLRRFIDMATVSARNVAARRRIKLHIEVPDSQARIDPNRIRQALDNMVGNAIRHSPDRAEIGVGAKQEADELRIWVEDAGPGFPEAFLERAFEPFVRADDEQQGSSGDGLGLAIVRAIGEAHGGGATAENRSEGGARVTLIVRT